MTSIADLRADVAPLRSERTTVQSPLTKEVTAIVRRLGAIDATLEKLPDRRGYRGLFRHRAECLQPTFTQIGSNLMRTLAGRSGRVRRVEGSDV